MDDVGLRSQWDSLLVQVPPPAFYKILTRGGESVTHPAVAASYHEDPFDARSQ